MVSEKRIEANRANAKKSTGPRSDDGKRRASQNAITHGLFAKALVIAAESEPEFNAYRCGMIEDMAPRGLLEQTLVERVVCEAWRLGRAVRMEQQWIDGELELKNPGLRGEQLADKLGAAVKDDFIDGLYDRLRRYEYRIERSMHKTLEEWRRIRQARAQEDVDEEQAAGDGPPLSGMSNDQGPMTNQCPRSNVQGPAQDVDAAQVLRDAGGRRIEAAASNVGIPARDSRGIQNGAAELDDAGTRDGHMECGAGGTALALGGVELQSQPTSDASQSGDTSPQSTAPAQADDAGDAEAAAWGVDVDIDADDCPAAPAEAAAGTDLGPVPTSMELHNAVVQFARCDRDEEGPPRRRKFRPSGRPAPEPPRRPNPRVEAQYAEIERMFERLSVATNAERRAAGYETDDMTLAEREEVWAASGWYPSSVFELRQQAAEAEENVQNEPNAGGTLAGHAAETAATREDVQNEANGAGTGGPGTGQAPAPEA